MWSDICNGGIVGFTQSVITMGIHGIHIVADKRQGLTKIHGNVLTVHPVQNLQRIFSAFFYRDISRDNCDSKNIQFRG